MSPSKMALSPCNICLDLEWEMMRLGCHRPYFGEDPTREIRVLYGAIIESKTCPICTAITHAIDEFDKLLSLQAEAVQMPSRLLHFPADPEDGISSLKLVERPPEQQKYVALSHCWGDKFSICTTTKATINDRLGQIPWASLPKTFQDAVSVTLSLGIHYLWIDSLCIIQDDEADWKAESVKMAEIYCQAYLTISATGASSSNHGCLSPRGHARSLSLRYNEDYATMHIPHAVSQRHSDRVFALHGIKVRYFSESHTSFHGESDAYIMGSSPLWQRAWAFQERILSNRTIHFHGEEMFWECHESTDCECGYFAWETAHGLKSDGNFHLAAKSSVARAREGEGSQVEAFKTWLRVVEEFTKLDITHQLDRLPAVSGMASYLSKPMKSSYKAGLWQYELGHGLAWQKPLRVSSRRVQSIPKQYIPTWSWASIEIVSHGISKKHGLIVFRGDVVTDPNLRLITPNSPLSETRISSFANIEDTRLSVQGKIITCTLHHSHHNFSRDSSVPYPEHSISFQKEFEFIYTDISCNGTPVDPEAATDVLCLLIATSAFEHRLPWSWRCVALGEKDTTDYIIQYAVVLQSDASGVYKRIGMSQHNSRKGWFADAEVGTVEII